MPKKTSAPAEMVKFQVHKITAKDERIIAYQIMAPDSDYVMDWLQQVIEHKSEKHGVHDIWDAEGMHIVRWIEFDNGDYYRLVPGVKFTPEPEPFALVFLEGFGVMKQVDQCPHCLKDGSRLIWNCYASMGGQHSNIYRCPKCKKRVEIYDACLDSKLKYFQMDTTHYPEAKGNENPLQEAGDAKRR